MRLLLYMGKSAVSKAIEWQTRSPYSHVAVELDDGRIVEAWHKQGVRIIDHGHEGHSMGTPIEYYSIGVPFSHAPVEAFLLNQVGKGYDWRGVWRFVSRRDQPVNDRWFCSELCVAAFAQGGLHLLKGNPSIFSPRDVSISPVIVYESTHTHEE